jgi:spore photoproduct lyase
MIKIITALNCEAKPLIDFFKLDYINEERMYPLYKNENISLIITGTGGINTSIANTYFLTKYNNTDFILNIGICGSLKNDIPIGKPFFINKIGSPYFNKVFYPDIIINHDLSENSICTHNKVINSSTSITNTSCSLVDMEAYYYFASSVKFLPQHKISLIKIVSDYLDTKTITPNFVGSLISKNLPQIENIILKFMEYEKKYQKHIFIEYENNLIKTIINNFNLTEYMKNEFLDYTKYYKLKNNNLDILMEFKNIKALSKSERKKQYEKLKYKLFNNFSHIYIEKNAVNYRITKEILSKFPKSELIYIDNYKNIFSRPNQDIVAQKKSKKIILAIKTDSFYYKNPDVCHNFGFKNSYYSSCLLNCIYDCHYCFLQGMYNSSNIVIFVNLEDYFSKIREILKTQKIHLSISYDTDLLALENITGYCEKWINFAKINPKLTIEIRTKSINTTFLKNISSSKNIIFAWSISPEIISKKYEPNTASFEKKLSSIKYVLDNNWPVRLCFDPIIQIENYLDIYDNFFKKVFNVIDSEKIYDVSIGSFRMPKDYLKCIKRSNLNSDLIYYPYILKNNNYMYKNHDLIIKSIEDILLKYINKNKIYII